MQPLQVLKRLELDWQNNFPYPTARKIQAESLQLLQDNFNNYDVFVIQAPTAFGKSAVARTIMQSLGSVSYITPTNLLVDQFRAEFPDTPTLSRLDSYHCEDWNRPCPVTKAKKGAFCNAKNSKCGTCPASKDLSTALYRRGPGAYNYHVYTAHKLYRDVLVVDEAHNLIPHIRSRMALRLWRHDYPYPLHTWTNQQLLEWLLTQPERVRNHKKMRMLHLALTARKPEYIVNRTTSSYNGKGTIRGEPEERDCIELLPVDISSAPPMFWPREVKKVILLSATINEKDVEALGFRGRICYIQCQSPIPADHRPIIVDPLISVNRNNLSDAAEIMAKKIEELSIQYAGRKGVIHATYQMSGLLRKHLHNEKYIFHNRENKKEKYREFLKSSDSILIACGMYEGIDLPGELGHWQVITKVPWMSLGNPAIKYMAEQDPQWYIWDCLRTTIQACGRICRSETDRGITYILDQTFERLYNEGNAMMPGWYQDALWDIRGWNEEGKFKFTDRN